MDEQIPQSLVVTITLLSSDEEGRFVAENMKHQKKKIEGEKKTKQKKQETLVEQNTK